MTGTARAGTLASVPDPIDFPNTTIGPPVNGMVVVTNSGTDTTITGVTETGGANCGEFSATATFPTTLMNNDTLTFTVTFDPTTRGMNKNCIFTITDDNGMPDTFEATGDGIAPQLDVNPTSLTFGNILVAGGTQQMMFDIENNGEQNLTVTSVAVTAGGADYSVSAAPGAPIAPGGAFTMTVTFNPSAGGTRNGTVTVTANSDPVDTTETVSLTGTGVTQPVIDVSPDDLTFPNVIAGQSNTQNVNFANTGDAQLVVDSATITGGSGWFVFTNSPETACNNQMTCDYIPDLTQAAGTNRNIPVRCQPPAGATGTQSAVITFTSNTVAGDSAGNLMCTAVKPDISVMPVFLDLGNTAVAGGTTMGNITITNTGTSTLSYTISNSNGTEFTYGGTQCGSPCTLTAGNNRVFTFTFNPTTSGLRTAQLTIASDDQESPTVLVDLQGTGDGAEIARTSPSPMAFGQVTVGTTSAALPLTFQNNGNTDLNISLLQMPNVVFQFSPPTPVIVPPGMSRTFNVTCSPTARTTYSGNIVATNNSYNNSMLATPVSCQGIKPDLRINGVDMATFDFMGVAEGSDVSQPFTLSNVGEQTAQNITASLSNMTAGYTFTGIPSSLGAGNMTTFMVTFSPTMVAQGGPVRLTANADPQGTFDPIEDAYLDLNGDGLSNGINVSTPTLDFMNVRWDDTAQQTFDITNTGQASLTVTSIQTSAGDFSIVQVQVDVAGEGTFETTLTGPNYNFQLCGTNDNTGACPGSTFGRARVTVRFTPNNTLLGVQNGMITVNCSLPPPDNQRVVTLTGTSTAPSLTVDPPTMILDFGAVDVDVGPVSLPLTFNNAAASTGPMDVQTRSALAAPFSAPPFVAPPAVLPGTGYATTMTFDPSVERSAAMPETTVVTFGIDGLYDPGMPNEGPTGVMITLSGYGTDRHIQVGGPVVFPPTYRRPVTPPELDVMVMNTGEAPLNLSMVMPPTEPAFELVSGGPQLVPGMQAATFRVRFNPLMAGNFSSTIDVMHDDDGSPIGQIVVSGTAILRDMSFMTPLTIGTAIVGEELNASGLITLTHTGDASMPPIGVTALTVLDTTGVVSVEAPAGRQIMPGESVAFDVSFTPMAAGRFQTTAQIFLDGDPDPHGEIMLEGYAVEIEVGGGCATSRGGGAGSALLIVAAALFARRRRRGAAVAAVAAVATCAVLVVAPAARADVAVQSFHPLPSIEDDLFAVESATVGKANAWAAGLAFSYALDPMVSTVISCGGVCNPDGSVMEGQETRLVKSQTMIAVGGAYALANRFEIGLTVPVLIQSGDSAMLASADGTTLGDVALHAKAKLLDVGPVSLGFGAVVTAPTAKDNQFAGYGGPSGQGILLASHRGRRLLISANAGFLARKTEDFANVQQGNALTFGVGGGYRVTPSLWVAAETFGEYGLVEDSQPSIQALAGIRVRMGDTFTFGLGGGFGMIDAIGVPKARGFALLTYSPAMRPQLAFEAPPPPRDLRDPDGDQIVNADDKCPNEAEDADVFEDEDGCPELDNDSDGVLDAMDTCKDQAEDADGFEDDDGCLDADNDKDGIADATDVCPNEPEDKDGNADLDGCPDNDNDHDGVVDGKDRCPAKPETINGNKDDDGCPDDGDSLVLLAAERIELLEPVKFIGKTAKLNKASHNILSQVAATLRANPEILKVRVTAHVHPRETREADQKLSDERAAAVKEWLVLWGIKIDRIDAKGFGSQKPLVKNQRKAEEINDRIEFVIMEKQ